MTTPNADWRDDWRNRDRAEVEAIASGATTRGVANVQVIDIGRARAELAYRDHEYAEEQERSRRQYEDDRAATRRDFEERLTKQQMDHASALTQKQLDTALQARNAARWAAVAAGVSAFVAVLQLIIAVIAVLYSGSQP